MRLFLDRTPFYAEGGGQVGDQGVIRTETGSGARDRHACRRAGMRSMHVGTVESGEVRAGQGAHAEIDRERREPTARAHTSTHVVHWTLKHVLGEHARQAGLAGRARPAPLRLPSPERRAARDPRAGRARGEPAPGHGRRGPSDLRDVDGRGARRSARSRCSARSTATSSASSRSVTTPRSCAAARTSHHTGHVAVRAHPARGLDRLGHAPRRGARGTRRAARDQRGTRAAAWAGRGPRVERPADGRRARPPDRRGEQAAQGRARPSAAPATAMR